MVVFEQFKLVFAVCKYAFPVLSNGKMTFLIPLALCGVVYCGVLYISGIVKLIIKGRKADNPQ